jgi:hypothetical protein
MYDFNGVWSGAATVPEESGIPVLTYTGKQSECCSGYVLCVLQMADHVGSLAASTGCLNFRPESGT